MEKDTIKLTKKFIKKLDKIIKNNKTDYFRNEPYKINDIYKKIKK